MNITHCVENLNRGGLERMVLDLVRMQHLQGHRCQIVCLFERGTLAGEADDLGIPVHACGKRSGPDVRALFRARSHVREHGTEVLHTHNAAAHYLTVWATTGMRFSCMVNTRHGMGHGNRPGRREWLFRNALGRTDAVVTVCDAARRGAIERGMAPAGLLRVIPNGIRVDAFAPASGEMHERLATALDLPPETRIMGTVGRLNWAKDQACMIRAFGRVHAAHPDTALVLIGGGELRDLLSQSAAGEGVAERVFFLGDRDDVGDLLRGLDLFVLSSVSEGYSMALLEACATGLPIVATDVGGNDEIVRDGITGRLVPSRDPDALADAMALLVGTPQLAATLGRSARAWVEREGTLEMMATRYQDVYEHT